MTHKKHLQKNNTSPIKTPLTPAELQNYSGKVQLINDNDYDLGDDNKPDIRPNAAFVKKTDYLFKKPQNKRTYKDKQNIEHKFTKFIEKTSPDEYDFMFFEKIDEFYKNIKKAKQYTLDIIKTGTTPENIIKQQLESDFLYFSDLIEKETSFNFLLDIAKTYLELDTHLETPSNMDLIIDCHLTQKYIKNNHIKSDFKNVKQDILSLKKHPKYFLDTLEKDIKQTTEDFLTYTLPDLTIEEAEHTYDTLTQFVENFSSKKCPAFLTSRTLKQLKNHTLAL